MNRSSSSSRAPAAPAARAALKNAPQQVRIIGGEWKRTPIQVVDADGLRPTPDRVRETVFNWLGQRLDGATCLDMFAGTGALGFEAASRGARRVLMIERQAKAAAPLRALKARLAATAVDIAEADALRFAAGLAAESFDVVFLDPPFGSDLMAKALLLAARLTRPQGEIYVELGAPLDAAADALAAAALSPKPRPRHEVEAEASPAVLGAYATLVAQGWGIARQGKAGAVHYYLLQRLTGLQEAVGAQ